MQKRYREALNTLNQYVSPKIVKKLQGNGALNVNLSVEKRDIAVMFVDIRGFTSIAEDLDAEDAAKILNDYFRLVTRAIEANGGTLDKYIGDEVMAIFNAPFDLDDYAYKAVCAARDILSGEEELFKRIREKFGRNVGFGIGINLGEAAVGNIGCESRKDYTAVGDTVNTASRLVECAATGQALISESVREMLGSRIEVEKVGPLMLKGKSQVVVTYQLLNIKEES